MVVSGPSRGAGSPNELRERESPGSFSTDGRDAAIRGALPYLSTYFADAPTWTLRTRSDVGTADQELDELAAVVRMRVAIAAAGELESILAALDGRASFQYTRNADDSRGALRGKLDVTRYVQTRARPEAPRRYPIRTIRRRYATPENALAAYAARWVSAELGRSPVHLLAETSPERRDIRGWRASLARRLRQPVLAEASDLAIEARRRAALDLLLDQVEARVERGHVAATDAYRRLIEWARRFDPERAAAQPGVISWAMYDDRFDTKLFEIWSLAMLVEALRMHLGDPIVGPRPLYERGLKPIAVWRVASARVLVHFQWALSRLGQPGARWSYAEPSEGPLRGVPDIGVVVERPGISPIPMIIDPKLRRREQAPTDEIYKLIGYFGNLRGDPQPLGAIVFYSPGEPQLYRLKSSHGGHLLAVGVDPADEATAAGHFEAIASLVLSAAGIAQDTLVQLRPPTGAIAASEDDVAQERQDAAVEAMKSAVGARPEGTLDPVRKTTAANLHGVWDLLTDEAQMMIVTAEYFGQHAPREADHSGPLLGLAATCERILYDVLFGQIVRDVPDLYERHPTLGSFIRSLDDASRSNPSRKDGQATASKLHQIGVDPRSLRPLSRRLHRLKNEFRNPAAHREIVGQDLWARGRSFILLSESSVLRLLFLHILGRT